MRFKSMLIDIDPQALRTMTAYIDLNRQKGRKGFTEAELEAVEKLQGKMPLAQVLRCRVRYFTDGAALGGAAFIEKVFRSNRSHFGSKRSSEPAECAGRIGAISA